jgi:hypothetical protein
VCSVRVNVGGRWNIVSVDVKVKVNRNVRCTGRAGIGCGCNGTPRRANVGSCHREAG